METNKNPYSLPSSVSLAFVDDLLSFGTVHSLFFAQFKPNTDWYILPEVTGSLQPNIKPLEEGANSIYEVDVSFRVAYATPENQNKLELFTTSGLILKYKKGSGKYAVLGTKNNFLSFSFSVSDSFDGFVCNLKGTQTTPECYSM